MDQSDNKNTSDETARIIVACKEGDLAAATDLLNNQYNWKQSIEWKDNEDRELDTPPIFIAMDYGQLDLVVIFLKKMKQAQQEDNIDYVNTLKDSNDYTLLSWASWNGNEALVNLLLAEEYGARVDQEALDLAKEYKQTHIVPILMERMDDLYAGLDGDDDEIMLKASREGHVKKVQELIASGYDLKKWKKTGDEGYQEYSPISIAMKQGHIDIIREFIQAGVEVELESTHFNHDVLEEQANNPPRS